MITRRGPVGSVLYVGHSYYHCWHLSRALRKLGWRADVLNIDPSADEIDLYHGDDFRFRYGSKVQVIPQLVFYARAMTRYEIVHFSNAHLMNFGPYLQAVGRRFFGDGGDVRAARWLGKKIVYSNNGCLDGVSQSSFRRWGPEPVCDICAWRDVPSVCSDERNLEWGRLRNTLADYQITNGGNRTDYNDDPRVHDVPEFYCLDPDAWTPDLEIPPRHRLKLPASTVKIYHAVGNFDHRTTPRGNIKSTHIYRPLVEQLKRDGYEVELVFVKDIPNQEVRFVQAQADIVVDMLTFGWFGANGREAMMLGKPVICYLRPEWLETVRHEVPDYVDELPVVSATPGNVREVLVDLIENPEKRAVIGRRSRAFALKWHSASAGARRLDAIYRELLGRSRPTDQAGLSSPRFRLTSAEGNGG